MKNTVTMLFAMLALSAQAQVFKCVDAIGKTVFSDRACVSGQQSELKIYKGQDVVQPVAPLSSAASAHEEKRKEARQKSNDAHARIDSAAAEVKRIKTENYDPVKCAAYQNEMRKMEARDPSKLKYVSPNYFKYKVDVDYFEVKQFAQLYCEN